MTGRNMEYDFAISYAGENKEIAEEIYKRIKQRYQDFTVFYAPVERHTLVGLNGEAFFDDLFKSCKEVIVLLSEAYKNKKWTRFEWDIIQERSQENRFIPIKLDDVKMLGMPSNIIYEKFSNNYEEIADLCINKLLLFEKAAGLIRDSEFTKLLNAFKDSEGALDKAFQLVIDKRDRTPLDDIAVPKIERILYKIHSEKWLNYSVIKRLQIRIQFPKGLSKEEIKENIHYCIATAFNKEKPDALSIFAYCKEDSSFAGFDNVFNVARATFAPYGKWEKAEEGFVYNFPVSKFGYKIDYREDYFV
jgi:hypothetical protein